MEITPNEMKNHEFSTQMRGYDKEEVKALIGGAAKALEDAYTKIELLSRDNESLNTRYDELKGLEDTIRSAVLEAQKNADQIVANSKKEAELTVQEAKNKADKLRGDKEKQLGDLEQKIQKLEYTKEQFYSKLRSEIEAHLKLVDSICPPDHGMKGEVVDSEPSSNEAPEDTAPIKERPNLEMKDDEIDAALDNLSGLGDPDQTDEPNKDMPENHEENQDAEKLEEALVNTATADNSSDDKEEVQDGQSKGYDF